MGGVYRRWAVDQGVAGSRRGRGRGGQVGDDAVSVACAGSGGWACRCDQVRLQVVTDHLG